jgi:predicted  nucleic acid-binding Zn-ribbon protein
MKINKLNLVLLSSLIGIHAIQATDKKDGSAGDAAKTSLTATTTMSPLKAAKALRMQKAAEARASLGFASMSESTPLPTTVKLQPATIPSQTEQTPASTTSASTYSSSSSTTKSSTSSKLAASGVFGDDDLGDLFGSAATATASKATTITKSDHEETLRLLEEQFKAAEEKSSKVFQGKITDLSNDLHRAQASLAAATNVNAAKDQQLAIVQGLHDTQKAEVTRLQSELKAKEDELATLTANAAKGSSVVDAAKIQQLTEELEKSNKALEDSKALLKKLNDENDRLVTDKLNLKGEIDAQVQSLAKLTQVQADLTAANQRVTEADRLKGVAETEMAAAKLSLKEAEAGKDKAEGQFSNAKARIATLEAELDKAKQNVADLTVNLAKAEADKSKAEGQFTNAKARINDLERDLVAAGKKETDFKAQQVRLENEHIAAMEAAASSHRVQLAERDEEQNEILIEFSKVCLSLAKNKLGLGGDQELTLEQVQNALSDNPLFAAMMDNETLRDLLSETAEAFSNSTPLNNFQLVASASSKSPTLGNDSDDDDAATTVTQGVNSSKKSNQAGNGNARRGGKGVKKNK